MRNGIGINMSQKLSAKLENYLYLVSPSLYYAITDRKRKKTASSSINATRADSDQAGKIKVVNIELSARCNLRCPMCWWWGEKGVGYKLTKDKDPMITKELTKEEIFNVIDQLELERPSFYLSGGEPFIRNETIEIIEYIYSKGLPIGMTNNGTMLSDDIIRRLSKIKTLRISFSLDGIREVHDAIRGDNNYDRTVHNINKLATMKRELGSDSPKILVTTTMVPQNIDSLCEHVERLKGIGIDSIMLQHLWYTTEESAKAHGAEILREFGVNDLGAFSHSGIKFSPDYPQKVAKVVHELRRKAHKLDFTITFFPYFKPDEIVKYYSDENFSKFETCRVPWNYIIIKANGDVLFCPDEWITKFNLGNVRNERICNMWNNEKAKKFRNYLLKGKFPICNHCCGFYL